MSQTNLRVDSESHDMTTGKRTPSRVDRRPGILNPDSITMFSDRLSVTSHCSIMKTVHNLNTWAPIASQ